MSPWTERALAPLPSAVWLDDERLVLYLAVFGCAFFLGLTIITFVCYCLLYRQRQLDRTTVYPVREVRPHGVL